MGDEADRIVINVGGIAYETYISTLQNIPDTRLAWLAEGIDPDPSNRKEIFFDRHSGVFVHILNYYRTGKLHTPIDICGPLFEEELNFWGIDEKQMEPCCWESFTKHREAEVNLKSFEGPGFEDLKNMKNRKFSSFGSQDGMTCRERMDQIWYIMDRPHSSKIAKYTSILSCFMIVLSVTVYCLNTLKSLEDHKTWNKARYVVDVFCMCWFTIEFTVRVLVCPDRKEFAKSIGNWIDFISVIPSYLKLFSIRDSWLINLVIIRLLRLFRFFKLSYGLQVLVHTLKASFYELILLLLILLIPIVIFSSLVHAIENLKRDSATKFTSIPATFWWCLITMTSVGYGDMVPETWIGKIIGSMCAICGVLIVALPISVIGSNFSLYYAHVRARLKLPSKDRKLLAGNIRGLLKQPLSLSSRERDRRVLKRSNLSALKRKGAARNREIVDASNRQSSSASSEGELVFGSPVNKLTSSENGLDWDSTVDSTIRFVHKKSRRRQKRKNTECDEDRLVSGNYSRKDTNEDATFSRSRRGGQISLYTVDGGAFIRNSSSCSSRNVKESETDNTSSDESKSNNLCRKSGTLNDNINFSPGKSLDKNVDSRNDSLHKHSTPISNRRTSMKLMDLERLPNCDENTLSGCGPSYSQTAMEKDQCMKSRKKVDIIQPVVTSDTDLKAKNRVSSNASLSSTQNHRTGLCEMKNTLHLQDNDKDYDLIAKSVMNCFPTENGRCQIGSNTANIRNSRSECTLQPTFNSKPLPVSVSETELKVDNNYDVPLVNEANNFGCDSCDLHTSLAEETALLKGFQYDPRKEEKAHPAMNFSKSEQDVRLNSKIQDIRNVDQLSREISRSAQIRLLESGI